jgi:hypothetical protein
MTTMIMKKGCDTNSSVFVEELKFIENKLGICVPALDHEPKDSDGGAVRRR